MTKTKGNTLKINKGLMKKVRFSGTTHKDISAYYKAYLLGSFDNLPDVGTHRNYSEEEFELVFSDYVNIHQLLSVTLYAFVDGSEIPVGVGIFWARGRILQVSNLLWFPWASPRNIFESCIGFYDGVRRTTHTESGLKYKVFGFSGEADKKMFSKLVDIKILTHVGEIDDVLANDERASFYTTVKVK